MKTIICRECGTTKRKYDREGSFFCDRKCYMEWKRKNPNKRAYKTKIKVSGYWYLYMPNHPNAIKRGRYIAEHRYILEQKIGRLLQKNEVAHHKNGDTCDNDIENLELRTIGEHNRQHALKRERQANGKFKATEVQSME